MLENRPGQHEVEVPVGKRHTLCRAAFKSDVRVLLLGFLAGRLVRLQRDVFVGVLRNPGRQTSVTTADL